MNRRTVLQSVLALVGLGAAKAVAVAKPNTFKGITIEWEPMLSVNEIRGRRIQFIILDERISVDEHCVVHNACEHVIDRSKWHDWPLPPKTHGIPFWIKQG